MKFSELVKTEKIKIPNTDLVIELKTQLTWSDKMEISKSMKDEISLGKELVLKLITNWNLEDDNGEKMPITENVIGKLPAFVVSPIVEKITEIAERTNQKKKVNKGISFLFSKRFKQTA